MPYIKSQQEHCSVFIKHYMLDSAFTAEQPFLAWLPASWWGKCGGRIGDRFKTQVASSASRLWLAGMILQISTGICVGVGGWFHGLSVRHAIMWIWVWISGTHETSGLQKLHKQPLHQLRQRQADPWCSRASMYRWIGELNIQWETLFPKIRSKQLKNTYGIDLWPTHTPVHSHTQRNAGICLHMHNHEHTQMHRTHTQQRFIT